MQHASVGRAVLSRPRENDGLIRAWLSRQGWRAPTVVKRGVIWVSSEGHANDVTSLLNRRWDEVILQPSVGIWEEVPRDPMG
jgi:hypothetical protein